MPCCAVAAGIFRRSAMPCFSASSKSIIQRMPASIAGCSGVACVVSCGSGPTAGSRSIGAPSAMRNERTARRRDRDPALRHRACERCALPGAARSDPSSIAAARELGRTGSGLSAGPARSASRCTLVGLKRACDPRRALRIEAVRRAAARRARSAASSCPARQICCQKCWPQRSSSCDSAGSCESTWIWSGKDAHAQLLACRRAAAKKRVSSRTGKQQQRMHRTSASTAVSSGGSAGAVNASEIDDGRKQRQLDAAMS